MRRHLGVGWAEWQTLSWYEQRALREGLLREFYNVTPASDVAAADTWADAGITFN